MVFNHQVERLLKIEKKVLNIPVELPIGPVILVTNPVKDALHGFAMAWKTQYASVLHEEAKVKYKCEHLLLDCSSCDSVLADCCNYKIEKTKQTKKLKINKYKIDVNILGN